MTWSASAGLPTSRRLFLGVVLALSGAASAEQTEAQGLVDQGATAFEAGDLARAEAVLRRAVASDPFEVGGDPSRAAGYWLGAVLDRAGDGGQAREVWLTWLQQAAGRGRLDVATADAFVRSTFRDKASGRYFEASEVHVLLLGTWGRAHDEDTARLVDRAVARTLLLMSAHERDAVEGAPDPSRALTDWWAAQDPLPGSELNERLVEHLERSAVATESYAGRGPTGWDGRGDLYVRLGPPSRTRSIDFYTPEFLRRIEELRRAIRNNLLVEPSDFADNELWVYQNVGPEGEEAQFLLVSDGPDDFRVGQTIDLIPARLRSGFDQFTGRGGAKADVVMEALRTIYRQLSTESILYGQRYNDVEGYVSQLETVRFRANTSGQGQRGVVAGAEGSGGRSDYSALVQGAGGGSLDGTVAPDAAVRSSLEVARREDEEIRARREEITPPQSSQAIDRIAPLPLTIRFSRFLTDAGETVLDVDWAPLPGGLALSDAIRGAADARGYDTYRDAVVRLSVVRAPGTGQRRVERREFVSVPERELDSSLPPEAHAFQLADDGTGGVALQWDEYVAVIGPDSTALGPRVRVAVVRAEMPEPLRADGLELSDLRPVRSVDQQPYPYRRIDVGEPISVYFEIYGLEAFGGRFTVEYALTQRQRGTVFRRGRSQSTEGRLISRVEGGRAQEYLIVNTADWADADEVDVTVTVKAGPAAQVQRTITFEVGVPSADGG